jgi:hypothetical protein
MLVLETVYQKGNFLPVTRYAQGQHAKRLTVQFLNNLKQLVMARFQHPFAELAYYPHEIIIDPKWLMPTRKRGLQIKSPFLWNHTANEMIFLTFGATDRMKAELSVFLTLSEQLSTTALPVDDVRQYTYWNLAAGEEANLSRAEIQPAPLGAVVATCNRILGST